MPADKSLPSELLRIAERKYTLSEPTRATLRQAAAEIERLTLTRAQVEAMLRECIVDAALWASGEIEIEGDNLRSFRADRFEAYRNAHVAAALARLELERQA